MRPDPRFARQDKSFWACVRSLSQEVGYTVRGQNKIKAITPKEMRTSFEKLGLNADAICDEELNPTRLGSMLQEYFTYRATILENTAAMKLMSGSQAKALYNQYFLKLNPIRKPTMNKQKGAKRAEAFLTGLVNMMVEHHAKDADCDYDPRKLTTITHGGVPLRTLARRVDGAFPSSVNPVAIWEIKEYYYTTTFGSRIADGVYETLLDGMELEELREHSGVDIKHYLMVDAYDTWWNDSKSYLCRIVDMLNMGYVDEVLFGREVVEEIPRLVEEWIQLARRDLLRGSADPPAST